MEQREQEEQDEIQYLINKRNQKLIDEEREGETEEEYLEKNKNKNQTTTHTPLQELNSDDFGDNELEYLIQKNKVSQDESIPLNYTSERNMYQADENGDDHTLPR